MIPHFTTIHWPSDQSAFLVRRLRQTRVVLSLALVEESAQRKPCLTRRCFLIWRRHLLCLTSERKRELRCPRLSSRLELSVIRSPSKLRSSPDLPKLVS